MSIRGVVRHVRYWRGQIHRWSTVYQYNGTPTSSMTNGDAQNLLEQDARMLYVGQGTGGGAYECELYNQASGGVPIARYVRYDWESPAAWLAPANSVWANPDDLTLNEPAEGALLVEWHAGLSSTGKPVSFKKWYHQVPTAVTQPGGPDISAANLASLTTQANALKGIFAAKGLVMGSPGGRLAGAAYANAFYANHQLRRGRRKKLSKVNQAGFSKILEVVENQAYSGT